MVQSLVDGNGIRGASRVCGVNRKTVARCLRKAGHHADAVASRLTRNVKLSEVQVDEVHAVVFKKDKNITPQDRILHPDAGTAWLFTSIDATTKFIPFVDVATDMKRDAIERFFRGLSKRINKPWPLFATDMRKAYQEAVAATLRGDPQGVRYVQARGHSPEYEGDAPPPTVHSKIIFGDKERIDRHYRQSKASNRINTAFIEVFHKTLRTANRRLQRRANGVSKKRRQLRLQLALYTTWYNFCKEHRTLRLENGHDGGPRKWDVRTPAMAAKLTNHKWTVEELLSLHA
jgi:transposase-like protein